MTVDLEALTDWTLDTALSHGQLHAHVAIQT
jgi:hypothetical protein